MIAHKHPVASVPAVGRPLTAAGTNPSSGAVAGGAQPADGASVQLGLEVTTPRTRTFSSETAPTMPCRECDGKGEAEYMGLCDSYYRWADCHKCFGSGREAPYCGTCEGPLVAGLCRDCDYPSGWAFAERSALGMVKP